MFGTPNAAFTPHWPNVGRHGPRYMCWEPHTLTWGHIAADLIHPAFSLRFESYLLYM